VPLSFRVKNKSAFANVEIGFCHFQIGFCRLFFRLLPPPRPNVVKMVCFELKAESTTAQCRWVWLFG
jgi:hypothetical protein